MFILTASNEFYKLSRNLKLSPNTGIYTYFFFNVVSRDLYPAKFAAFQQPIIEELAAFSFHSQISVHNNYLRSPPPPRLTARKVFTQPKSLFIN